MKEFFNVKMANYILSLTKTEIRNNIYDNTEKNRAGEAYNFSVYCEQVKELCKKIIKGDGTLITNYKYGKGNSSGRRYSDGFRAQGLQTKLRGALIIDMIDYDMISAHPSILRGLAVKKGLDECDYKYLTEYVNNREYVLNKHNLTKKKILVNMNIDNPNSSSNNWLRLFNNEMSNLKEKLIDDGYPETDNTNNPISSRLNKKICEIENELLQRAISKFEIVNGVLMFDGFLSSSDLNISELNSLTSDYNIKWKVKAPDTQIEIPEDWELVDYEKNYEDIKIEFEKSNNIILKPFCFQSLAGGSWSLLSLSKMREKYAHLPKRDKNTFIQAWIEDPTKKQFTTRDFIPHNKCNPIIPDDIFNTFVPFRRLNADTTPTNPINNTETFITDYVGQLTWTLAEENDEMSNYLLDYIAHMIQYPSILPETVIVLKGNEGVGKDKLISLIGRLLDNRSYCISTAKPDLIFGQFNSGVENKLLVHLNEAKNSNAIAYLEEMKDNSTSETMEIQKKGNDIYTVTNRMRLFIASNNTKPVVPGRRYNLFQATDRYRCDIKFFGRFSEYMEDEGVMNGLFKFFNDREIEDFDPRKFPKGKLHEYLEEDNVKPLIRFLHSMSVDSSPFFYRKNDTRVNIKTTEFRKLYINWCSQHGLNGVKTSTMNITLQLNDLPEWISKKQIKKHGIPTDHYLIEISELKIHLKEKFFSKEEEIVITDDDIILNGEETEEDEL